MAHHIPTWSHKSFSQHEPSAIQFGVASTLAADLMPRAEKDLASADDKAPDPTARLGWIPALINAFVTLIISIKFVYLYPFNYSLDYYIDIYDPLAVFAVYFFIAYMILDLILGSIFYPKHMDWLSGYVHHILYIGIFGLWLYNNMAIAACLTFFEEIPTLILSIGKINHKYRSDAIFGLSFFLIRIVYHGYLVGVILVAETLQPVLLYPSLLAMSMHIYWFYTWLIKYGLPMINPNYKKSKK